MPVKTNRKIALSEQNKNQGYSQQGYSQQGHSQQGHSQQGHSQAVETLAIEAGAAQKVWLEQVDFPLLLVKQVFINKDNTQGFLYLITSI